MALLRSEPEYKGAPLGRCCVGRWCRPAVLTLGESGLRISRSKIRIMGPSAVKLLTGTRLGRGSIRTPKARLSRVRSGIYKLSAGLVQRTDQIKFVDGIVAQLRYVERLNPKDASALTRNLATTVSRADISASAARFLVSKIQKPGV